MNISNSENNDFEPGVMKSHRNNNNNYSKFILYTFFNFFLQLQNKRSNINVLKFFNLF